MKYVIQLNFLNMRKPLYIGKGSYYCNCEHYICLTQNTENAKAYSSYNRAKAAIERILDSDYSNVTTDYNICSIDPKDNHGNM